MASGIGHNMGAFHQALVNGTAWAFHHRIQVLSTGSPGSCGMRPERFAARGQVQKTARPEKAMSATRAVRAPGVPSVPLGSRVSGFGVRASRIKPIPSPESRAPNPDD
jgi:hypothetical protein